MGRDAKPEQMTVQPFQFANQRAQIKPAPGHFQVHDFFDRLNKRGRVGVGADAADALEEVKALVIIPFFAGFFDSTVVVPDVHAGADDLFSVDVEIKFGRFLQERMLRAYGYAKGRFIHVILPPLLRFLCFVELHIFAQRVNAFRPFFGHGLASEVGMPDRIDAEQVLQFPFVDDGAGHMSASVGTSGFSWSIRTCSTTTFSPVNM